MSYVSPHSLSQTRPAGASVKGGAPGTKPSSSLRKAAEAFEAQFLHMVFKSMRATVPKEDLMNGGFADEIFTDMMDTEVAEQASRTGQLGIADMLVSQLGGEAGPALNLEPIRSPRAMQAAQLAYGAAAKLGVDDND